MVTSKLASISICKKSIRRCKSVVKLWGNAGEYGVPLPFLAGNAVPIAYCGWTRKTAFSRSMTATYNTSNRKKCALNT